VPITLKVAQPDRELSGVDRGYLCFTNGPQRSIILYFQSDKCFVGFANNHNLPGIRVVTIVEVTVVAGIGENLWGEDNTDISLAMGGVGNESGVA